MSMHPAAAQGFAAGAEAYERGRPSYPDEALDHVAAQLAIGPATTLLDLAAGTGKFTRLLARFGPRIVAVEPIAQMGAHLVAQQPDVRMAAGTAEALPLASNSFDAVTVAQGFHWFQPASALAEIARVLRPGAALALVWNARDEDVPWVADLTRAIDWHEFNFGHYRNQDWAAVVAGSSDRFTPVEHATFPYSQRLDEPSFVDRIASISYIAAMEPIEREETLRRARAVIAGFPPEFDLPYVTEVWTCQLRSA
jgi:SAM-dependent methyltransferase